MGTEAMTDSLWLFLILGAGSPEALQRGPCMLSCPPQVHGCCIKMPDTVSAVSHKPAAFPPPGAQSALNFPSVALWSAQSRFGFTTYPRQPSPLSPRKFDAQH